MKVDRELPIKDVFVIDCMGETSAVATAVSKGWNLVGQRE